MVQEMSNFIDSSDKWNEEVRKLKQAKVTDLARILDNNDNWKKFMSVIPAVNPETNGSEFQYSVEDINLISDTAKNQQRSPTEILLDEWGITGRKRPTLSLLFDCLKKAEQFRAADLIAEYMNVPPPERPAMGPAALVPVPVDGMYLFSYGYLESITQRFSQNCLLGCGSFGNVYRGELPSGPVAIKRLSEVKIMTWAQEGMMSSKSSVETSGAGDPLRQFINEVKVTSQVRHKNLLAMLGYSEDVNSPPCLVYEYMPNGSLYDRIQDKTMVLGWNTRMNIALGTAEGIHYLHSQPTPLIHRDVKSANILLNENFNPKLGDYGLVRVGSINTTKQITTAFGTAVYMSPEAIRGEVSLKMDVYSYGVVLLELVTGLPILDENRENVDLITFYEDQVDDQRHELWDRSAGWPVDLPKKVFELADQCLIRKKKDRPHMLDVINLLEAIMNCFQYYV